MGSFAADILRSHGSAKVNSHPAVPPQCYQTQTSAISEYLSCNVPINSSISISKDSNFNCPIPLFESQPDVNMYRKSNKCK